MKLLPDPGEYSEKRLFCLDILRGIDMLYLSCIAFVLSSTFRTWPEYFATFPKIGEQAFTTFFTGHPWYGFTVYDIIMPLFIFMSGAAVPFALGRRLDNGRPTAAFWKHIAWRVVMLWTLGMLAQGSLSSWDFSEISLYSNTLQTIAVGYVAAAFVLLIPRRLLWVRVAIPVALLVVYGFLVHLCGDYTKDGSICQIFELKVFGVIYPAGHPAIKHVKAYGYTWLLPSMMFPVLALGGCFATQILRLREVGEWRRALYLLLYGGGSLLAGLILEWCGVKCVKHFFSVSFTLQAIGWSVLLLDALYVITDIRRLRRGTGLLLLFGQFALTAYLCEAVFRGVCIAFWNRLFGGLGVYADRFAAWCGSAVPVKGITEAVGFSLVCVLVMAVRRRLAAAKD